MTLTEYIAGARRILLFTGAGISTNSGIPDFRGPQGVWTRKQPVYYDEFMAFEKSRVEYWEQKLESWGAFMSARPNAVHYAACQLEQAGRLLAVVTQNVDGLHAQAGTSRDKLIEVHGTNAEVECQKCLERRPADPVVREFEKTRVPPRCECGGVYKTATISFGQSLKREVLAAAYEAAARCDLVIALGSTLGVQPAAGIPLMAADKGTSYVVINRGKTEHDDMLAVSLRLDGDVGTIFPEAVQPALGPIHR